MSYPFGHGLSYTTFHYGQVCADVIEPATSRVELRVVVANTGARAGQEVVQVYVGDVEAALARPVRELKAHRKITLEPGEQKLLTLELDRRAFAYYHPGISDWVVERGTFEVAVGASSRDLRTVTHVDLPGESRRTPLTEWSTLAEFIAHPVAGVLLDREINGCAVGLAMHLLGKTSMITPDGMLRQIDGLPMIKLIEIFDAMPFGHERLAELIKDANSR